ncbi:MAG: gamma-glutamyltransferase family protein [Lachnospira sp.]
MVFDNYDYTYTSRRNVVYAAHGMVATAQNLAAEAGLEILKAGGNAIDAAVATAIALTVVEPTSNGIGSDAFALIWTGDNNVPDGLNASGPAGALASSKKMRDAGYDCMPTHGFKTVTVPGAPSAWIALSKKYGKLPFAKLFEPAIRYAEEGFAVSPVVANMWKSEVELHVSQHGNLPEYQPFFDTFSYNRVAPKAGEIWKNPAQAKTLRELAQTECESFYRGAIADKFDEYSKKYDGDVRKEDLAAFYPEWVKPISVNYRGYDVWEIPPNGHGIVALMALNILNGFEFDREHKETAETYHKQIEAMKLAYEDGKRYVTDPRYMKYTFEQLLSDEYASVRRGLISDKAIMPMPGKPDSGGTVYLCAADDEGNMISYIQSNFHMFGSGMVIPDTGISLQNRGMGFSLDEDMENCLAPGKKPYHTIIPGFLTKDGEAVGPFGVMGGFMQPQGHVQVVTNMIDFHLNPQQALDTPRWRWMKEKDIEVEENFPKDIYEDLKKKGHNISVSKNVNSFGRGEIIVKCDNGVYAGATEPRADGAVLGY